MKGALEQRDQHIYQKFTLWFNVDTQLVLFTPFGVREVSWLWFHEHGLIWCFLKQNVKKWSFLYPATHCTKVYPITFECVNIFSISFFFRRCQNYSAFQLQYSVEIFGLKSNFPVLSFQLSSDISSNLNTLTVGCTTQTISPIYIKVSLSN